MAIQNIHEVHFFFFFNLTTFGCTCMQRGMRSKLFLFLLVSQLATMTKSPGEEFPFLEAADGVRELGLHSVPRSERLSPSGRGRHVQKKKKTPPMMCSSHRISHMLCVRKKDVYIYTVYRYIYIKSEMFILTRVMGMVKPILTVFEQCGEGIICCTGCQLIPGHT